MTSEKYNFKKPNWTTIFFIGLGITAFISLIINVFIHFFPQNFSFGNDEAEHLRIVFGFDSGQFPFRNYLENHPILPHIFMHYLKSLMGIQSISSLFYLSKLIVFSHFFGCIFIISRFLKEFRNELEIKLPILGTILIAMGAMSIWDLGTEWVWGLSSIWMVRPDWPANFYVLLGFYLHFKMIRKIGRDSANPQYKYIAVLSGASLAVSVVILPKFVFFGIPYVLSFAVLSATSLSNWHEKLHFPLRKLVYAHIYLLCGFLATAMTGISFELNFLKVSAIDYYNYVYALNMMKHVLTVNFGDDYSPWNILKSLLGISLLPFCGLFAIYFGFISFLSRHKPGGLELGILILCGFILAFNMLIPAFTNGLIFPWYFSYSILALIVLIVFLINRVFAVRSRMIKILFCVLICFQVVRKLVEATQNLVTSEQGICLKSLEKKCFADLIREPNFPKDFTYFSFFMYRFPVKAQLLNYYSLGPNLSGLWLDGAALKLGPDPEADFKRIFELNPPDAVTAGDFEEFESLASRISIVQKVNLSWLNEMIRRDYVCYVKRSDRLLVLRRKSSQLSKLGWAPCPSVK